MKPGFSDDGMTGLRLMWDHSNSGYSIRMPVGQQGLSGRQGEVSFAFYPDHYH